MVVCLAVTVACVIAIPKVSFEYNFSNLEPEYDEYYRRAEALEPVFGQSERRNPAYLLLDTPQAVQEVTEAVKSLSEQDSLILAVESLQERFPTDSAGIAAKLIRLADIREVLNDPFLLADTTGQIDRLRRAASATEPIPLDSVPAFLTRPFTTRSGEIGNFVIVFPRGNMADGRRSKNMEWQQGSKFVIFSASRQSLHGNSASRFVRPFSSWVSSMMHRMRSKWARKSELTWGSLIRALEF